MPSRSSGLSVFVQCLLRKPAQIGAVLPSSARLSELMASCVDPDAAVLELGAGTGPVTQALLHRGVVPEQLFVIEREPSLASYLQSRFPRVQVMCGDAMHSAELLSEKRVRRVTAIVSSVPFRNLPERARLRIMRAVLKTLAPGGQLIQFTYALGCPIPSRKLGLKAECLGRIWQNLPPAAVWRFTKRP